MVLEEYRGGGRRNCFFVPTNRDGRGWCKLVEVLREAARSGVQAPSALMVGHYSLPSRSYKEALQRSSDLSHQQDRVARRAASFAGGAGFASLQGCEVGGSGSAGLKKENILQVMSEMQKQLEDLQFNLNSIK